MTTQKTIFISGHNGMVGSALMRQLSQRSHLRFITRTRAQLELINQADVFKFFEDNDIDEVYLAAAKVGGIHANKTCLLYTSPSPRDGLLSRMPSSA